MSKSRVTRFLICFCVGLVLAGSAQAQQAVYLDDNFSTSTSFTSSESGGLATLGGTSRILTQVGVALDRQIENNTGTIDVVLNLYDINANEDPGNLLFTTFIDDFVLPSDVEFFLDVDLPNLVVPDRIAWTTIISDSTAPFSVGRTVTTGPSIGTFDGGRFRPLGSEPWTNTTNSIGFRAFAVPEPNSSILLAGVFAFLAQRRKRRM